MDENPKPRAEGRPYTTAARHTRNGCERGACNGAHDDGLRDPALQLQLEALPLPRGRARRLMPMASPSSYWLAQHMAAIERIHAAKACSATASLDAQGLLGATAVHSQQMERTAYGQGSSGGASVLDVTSRRWNTDGQTNNNSMHAVHGLRGGKSFSFRRAQQLQ